VSRSWWPLWDRSRRKSEKTEAPGEKERSQRLDDTRRIVRHVAQEAYRSPPEPEPVLAPTEALTISVYGDITHVNFHSQAVFDSYIVRVDPVTKKTTRVARRFDKSSVFYRRDGVLIDDYVADDTG
jgi:hypothetical protein